MRLRRPGNTSAGHAATSSKDKPAGKTCASLETPSTQLSEGKKDECGKNSSKVSKGSRRRSKGRGRSRNRSRGKGKREKGRTLAISSAKP